MQSYTNDMKCCQVSHIRRIYLEPAIENFLFDTRCSSMCVGFSSLHKNGASKMLVQIQTEADPSFAT